MHKIELVTGPIHDRGLVAELEMPPFDPTPEVIQWGSRHFGLAMTKPDGVLVYAEIFCWVAPIQL